MVQRRALVAGGAGFIGSHLCGRLLEEGYQVLCMDNLITGSAKNISHLKKSHREEDFGYIEHDVTERIELTGSFLEDGPLDEVYHLASPASPPDFERIPIPILKVGSYGTHNLLELAKTRGARFLLASTSEVYGDPLVHPQPEDYRGNVSPVGVRSVYDEAKRYAEALTMAYHRSYGLQTRIARIFNTYGPKMRPEDGRMIPNFISQALAGEPLTIYGDGTQTRSVQYVDDLVEGLLRLMRSQQLRPVNLGNPLEYSVREVAGLILELTGSESEIVHKPLPKDDPRQRRPEISRAKASLEWEPRIGAKEGLSRTVEWFAAQLENQGFSS